MARYHTGLCWISLLGLGLTSCNSAYADRAGAEHAPLAHGAAHAPVQSPYQVDLIDENGQTLNVYKHRGRFYVLGTAGDRYTIRVSNPTPRRVEAIVSVDGLDVIDGEAADLRKRGYVVPAYGELRVDGFRVSTQQVAAFRFSSVSNSYAGRKGVARNVGVIGVAIFEEQAPPEVIVQSPVVVDEETHYEDWNTVRGGAVGGRSGGAPRDYGGGDADFDAPAGAAEGAPAPDSVAPPPPAAPRVTRSPARNDPAPAAKRAPTDSRLELEDKAADAEGCCGARPRERPGLGTEFGEYRHSNVSWTQFVRANATRPTAMAELRYNDADGLRALGIQLQHVDADELYTRESAEPFPGSRGFAQPPR